MISGEFSVYVYQVVTGPPAGWIGVIEGRNRKRMWYGGTPESVKEQAERDFGAVVHPWKLGYWDRDGWTPGLAPSAPVAVRR